MPDLRILELTTSFPRSEDDDSSVFVLRLCQALSKLTKSVKVLVPSTGSESGVESFLNIEVQRFKYWPWRSKLTFGAGLIENIKNKPSRALLLPFLVIAMAIEAIKLRLEYDVLHANWIVAGAAAWLVNLIIDKPYIVTLRGSEMMLIKSLPIRLLYYPILRNAKAITTVGSNLESLVKVHFPKLSNKVFCVENGVEVLTPSEAERNRFIEQYSLSYDKPYIVAVGSVIPRKGLEKILKVLAHPLLANFQLIICGRCEQRDYHQELEMLAHNLKISERVQFLGAIPPKKIACALSISTAFLSASTFEGRPNSVLEALTFGIPVIISDIPQHKEIVCDGKNGFIVDFEDKDKAATLILSCYNNSAQVSSMIEQAKSGLKELTWDKCADKYIHIFRGNFNT